MVGFICFFIEEHLWFGCGAPFVVKSAHTCQDIFLNIFFRYRNFVAVASLFGARKDV